MRRPTSRLLPYAVALTCLAFGVHDPEPHAAERSGVDVTTLAGSHPGPGGPWTFDVRGGRLRLRAGERWLELEPVGERTFRASTPPLTVRFVLEDGAIVGCRVERGE